MMNSCQVDLTIKIWFRIIALFNEDVLRAGFTDAIGQTSDEREP